MSGEHHTTGAFSVLFSININSLNAVHQKTSSCITTRNVRFIRSIETDISIIEMS
jgi:hypothetical protein